MDPNPLLLYLSARDRLDSEERTVLDQMIGQTQKVIAGADIVREGAEPIESCLMLDGFAARYHLLTDGGRNISAIHIAGDFLDLHSLLLSPMDHSVIALSDCTVSMVPHKLLLGLTHSHPHLARLLWMTTLIDAAMHRRWLMAAGRLSAAGRIAHFLCEIYVRLKTVQQTEDQHFWLPLTQLQLSDAMGLSTVHINRTLQELRHRNLIRWEAGRVEILNWDGLQNMAQFDATYLNLEPRPR